MTIISETRPSDSPYVAAVTRGWTEADGAPVRPAETHWHMVIARYDGRSHFLAVGPWSTAGVVTYGAGAEILWIQLQLGVYLPHLPTRNLRDREILLPGAGLDKFWLKSSTWQFPDFENVETFIDRLVREEMLVQDPVVRAVLQGRPVDASPRTVRHRFLHAAGMAHHHIRQVQRAQQAAERLASGASILDAAYELGYYDQPHLTRALKQYTGHTPAEFVQQGQPG